MFFGDRIVVFGVECKREPVRDIARDAPKGLETPHAITKRGIRGSISMQLNAAAGTPSVAQAKSGTCGNLDITHATYVGVARCFIASMINERYLKPHSPVLLVAGAPSP